MEEIVHPKGKIYYSVGEVCELFGVNASLLRFWEEEFPVLKIAKNSRGHRIYTPADVDNLRLIYHLVKEQGMTLEGAKKRLRQNPEGVEVIDIDDEESEEVVATAPTAPVAPTEEVTITPTEVVETPEVVAPRKAEPAKENLAAFKMEMPSSDPAPEEPRKPRTPKLGTLIGGDLFDPQDMRMAVAKQRSEEAKKQVVEQTLF